MNNLLSVNNTSEKSFEKKLFNPFNFQQIMNDEGNDPDQFFLMIILKLLVRLVPLLMNFRAPLIVLRKIHFLSYRLALGV